MPDVFEGRNNTTSTLSGRRGHDGYHPTERGLEPGMTARGDAKFEPAVDVYRLVNRENTLVNKAGDKWLHITSMQNAIGKFIPVDLWMAEIHLGRPYLTVTPIGEPPAGDTRTITYVELDDADQSVWLPESITPDHKIVLKKQ